MGFSLDNLSKAGWSWGYVSAVDSQAWQAFQDRFSKDPQAARITLRAQGHLEQGGTCKIDSRSGDEVGVHRALGGSGLTACSGDILLESLVACAGVMLSQIAIAMEIELRNAVIRAEGDLDFRGSLGLSEDVPVGLEPIRLHSISRPTRTRRRWPDLFG